jgi:hypothetical protein
MTMASVIRRNRQAKKRQRAESLLVGDGSPSGLAVLRTKADSFINESVAPLLRRGENVLHQAYVVDRDMDSAGVVGALFARGLFAALTTERVILISTRLGIFGPALENRAVESIERSSILGCQRDGEALVLDLADGGSKRLVMRVNEGTLSNRRTFARDVLRTLTPHLSGSPSARAGPAFHSQ